jgi:hypothetical protein
MNSGKNAGYCLRPCSMKSLVLRSFQFRYQGPPLKPNYFPLRYYINCVGRS